jgi:DNA-binding NarL/FixJ family response regulator
MSTPLKIRVLLADDHAMVRSGLRMVLDAHADIEVVAEAGDGNEAVKQAIAHGVDLAILDVSMPRLTGLQAAEELHRRSPEIRVLMLSTHESEQYCFEALKVGAAGYVLKTSAHRDLVEACRASMRGEPFVGPPAITAIVRDVLERSGGEDAGPLEPLSPRERQVVKLVAEGHTGEEIAALLGVGLSTVERHRTRSLAKLGLRNRVDLTRYAIRRGLVQP